jgi:hypothetical protein
MVSAMSDDDKKTTDGTADEADTLKHIGGSESDAWNNYIGAQALASIRPYIGDEEKRDKMPAVASHALPIRVFWEAAKSSNFRKYLIILVPQR